MKILIVGGGAAGWITALILKQIDTSLTIEVIESDEIGILGAGESLPISFNSLLVAADINEVEFIKETESTYKVGVKFDSWAADNATYLNPIRPALYEIDVFKDQFPKGVSPIQFAHLYSYPTESMVNVADFEIFCFVNNIDINGIGINKFILSNKAPFIQIIEKEKSYFQKINSYALHINAKLAAKYLRKKALERGVIRHEGKVIQINGNYPIESVKDDRGNIHKFDFIIDCSGFARLIIGKHLNSKWIDYSKSLPVDSTIPFFMPTENEISPYTQATAMKYGWLFKVPTKNRYGCGYNYDSNLIDKEQAIKEVQEKLGKKIDLVNFFKFKSGIYEEQFKSNCLALGLSSGFLEPMAATSMGLLAGGLLVLLLPEIKKSGIKKTLFDEEFKQTYNKRMLHRTEQRICEIFTHYVTPRNDTLFWQHFKNKDNWPTLFRNAYENSFSNGNFDWRRFGYETDVNGHTMIPKILGNAWFKKRVFSYAKKYNLNENYYPILLEMQKQTKRINPVLIDHKQFLEVL